MPARMLYVQQVGLGYYDSAPSFLAARHRKGEINAVAPAPLYEARSVTMLALFIGRRRQAVASGISRRREEVHAISYRRRCHERRARLDIDRCLDVAQHARRPGNRDDISLRSSSARSVEEAQQR